MKLGGIKNSEAGYPSGRRDEAAQCIDAPGESRALVPLSAATERQRDTGSHPRPAMFLAHLIAASTQVPQARERRRAEPADATCAYEAAMAAAPLVTGRNFSRNS